MCDGLLLNCSEFWNLQRVSSTYMTVSSLSFPQGGNIFLSEVSTKELMTELINGRPRAGQQFACVKALEATAF